MTKIEIITVGRTHYMVGRPMLEFSNTTLKFIERRPVMSADGILLGWLDNMPKIQEKL